MISCAQLVMKAVLLDATSKAVANVTLPAITPACLTPAPTSATVCIYCIILSYHYTHCICDKG